ncbi:MAG: hypothetical protein M1817_004068 [Caeruleum heppii]|nr:MAG: hypothetical protein M1817_004068 [Caeruleum heppii]
MALAPDSSTTAATPASKPTTEPSNPSNTSQSSPSPADTSRTPAQADFAGDIQVTNDPPTAADLDRVADLVVLGADGSSVPFRSLYEGEGKAKRVLVVFIRHFFCGNCQEYVRTLSATFTPSKLLALPVPTSLVLIGCGAPSLIDPYITDSNCPFPVYADPSRKLYDHLGMTKTLHLGPKPEYVKRSFIGVLASSTLRNLMAGREALKGGDQRQVGGEFLFDDGKVTWCHRMRNTRDHAEMPALRRLLGFDGPTADAKSEAELNGHTNGVLTGGPTRPVESATPDAAAEPVVDPMRRRRSLGPGGMMKRMSGNWGRRISETRSRSRKASGERSRPRSMVVGASPVMNGGREEGDEKKPGREERVGADGGIAEEGPDAKGAEDGVANGQVSAAQSNGHWKGEERGDGAARRPSEKIAGEGIGNGVPTKAPATIMKVE